VEDTEYRSVEDVFNANVDSLLADREMTHRDLLDRLEQASYTPETPATVLLNDAVAIAAVLGVSPMQLLVPPDHHRVDITPALSTETRLLGLWLRGLRPLLDDHSDEFFRSAPVEDLDADLVAENWVWSERVRTTALAFLLEDAVRDQNIDRVRLLSELATRQLDQTALERADDRVARFIRQGELRAALEHATRYRRQATPARVTGNDSLPAGP
jgi:hypothetical protein